MRFINKNTGTFLDVSMPDLVKFMLRSDSYIVIKDADFIENEHPRDLGGKFSTAAGGGGGEGSFSPTGKAIAPISTPAKELPVAPTPPKAAKAEPATTTSTASSSKKTTPGYVDKHGYERSPGLDDKERKIEGGFYDNIRKDPKQLISDYHSKYGNIVDPDLVKRLDKNFVEDNTLAAAVHEPSSHLSKLIWKSSLEKKAANNDTSPTLFTAGGSGSGKTEAMGLALDLLGAGKDSLTFDSVLGNFKSAVAKIDQALEITEGNAEVIYTNAPLELAMQLNLRRSRTVRIDTVLAAHIAASNNIRKLSEHYKDNPRVSINVINNLGDPPDMHSGELSDVPDYGDKDKLKEKMLAHARKFIAEGHIKDGEKKLEMLLA